MTTHDDSTQSWKNELFTGTFSRGSKAPKIPIYDDDDFFNKEVKLSLSKILSILNPYSVTLKTNCKQPHLM